MDTVTAKIDVTRPIGRKLVRELENKRYVKIQYPEVKGIGEKTYTLREAFEEGERILSEYYGVEIKLRH